MTISLTIKTEKIKAFSNRILGLISPRSVVVVSSFMAFISTAWFFTADKIVAYGDAESHLNIAKRVVDGLTPGFAQLGGIWLPLPHILLIPFVKFDFLWRTGLAGSIVSGVAFVLSALFIYKIILLLFKNKSAAFMGAIVFITNLNILYLQATPMTELTLIVFFIISTYYFIKFLNGSRIIDLIFAAVFGFCATLSRYDGWFFVGIEILILMFVYNPFKKIPKSIKDLNKIWDLKKYHKMEGILIIFTTLGFLGIIMWLGWDALILGDPLYFTHSEFSASSQQQGWLAHGELPTYHNVWLSFAYYFITAMNGAGIIVFFISLVGLIVYLKHDENKHRFVISLLITNIFLFYVLTLFMGQSVIFIPHITPADFDWTLFNVRYGVMMVPFAAIFFSYLFSLFKPVGKFFMIALLLFQFSLYAIGYSLPLSYTDGVEGLSSSKRVDAEKWLKINYKGGLVLEDDFSRQLSIIRSGVPMENVIYIGNKPYWAESLEAPEKYATWIIVQQNDTIDKKIYQPPAMNGRLFKYFKLAYTSPEILIFERNDLPANSK